MRKQIRRLVAGRPWVALLALEGILALSVVVLALHWLLAGRHPQPPAAAPAWSAPAPSATSGAAASSLPKDLRRTPSPGPTARAGPSAAGTDLPPDFVDRLNDDARTRYLNEWSVARRLTRAVEQYLASRVLPPLSKGGRTDGPAPTAHR